MLKKYFLPLFLLTSACPNIGQTERPMSFIEQLRSVPIWTEKKSSDTDSNVLYRLSVNTNGDIKYYDDTWHFVSSVSPSKAVYSVEDRSRSTGEKKELLLSIQSNSVAIENPSFSINELFRSPKEPLDRVFITNLLAIPIWYPLAVWNPDNTIINRFTYIRMIVESNGNYYPDNSNLKKHLHWTFVSANSPTSALFSNTFPPDAPAGVPIPMIEVDIEANQLIQNQSRPASKICWPRQHDKPADLIDDSTSMD